VAGIRAALERGPGRRPAPVLATLAGSAAAVLAVVMAVVFGASLNGLVTHPARYGWNWTLLMDTEGGYGSWPPSQMDKLVSGQPGVTGWSTFAFTQIPIDGQEVPALGLTRHLGSVQPPTTSGHPLSGPLQIELGTVTLRALGKHVGDTVTAGTGRYSRTLTIVGTVTLPSIGLAVADHVSLGRGAMLSDSTLLAVQGLSPKLTQEEEQAAAAVSDPAFPSAVAIDLAPGADAAPLVARISAAGPGGTPGGTYRQPRVLGAAIVNAAQMGSQPLALALTLAAAAVLALGVGPPAPAAARPAENPRPDQASGPGGHRLAGNRHPPGSRRHRGAARTRGRPLGVDQLRCLPRRCPGNHRPRPRPAGRLRHPAGGREPAGRHSRVGSRPDKTRRHAAGRIALPATPLPAGTGSGRPPEACHLNDLAAGRCCRQRR
jgi:hypothetical protein